MGSLSGAGFLVPGADHVEHLVAGQAQLPLGLGELSVQFQPAGSRFLAGLAGVDQMAGGLALLDRVRRREALFRWASANGYRLLSFKQPILSEASPFPISASKTQAFFRVEVERGAGLRPAGVPCGARGDRTPREEDSRGRTHSSMEFSRREGSRNPYFVYFFFVSRTRGALARVKSKTSSPVVVLIS
jgi:hypothetical protein